MYVKQLVEPIRKCYHHICSHVVKAHTPENEDEPEKAKAKAKVKDALSLVDATVQRNIAHVKFRLRPTKQRRSASDNIHNVPRFASRIGRCHTDAYYEFIVLNSEFPECFGSSQRFWELRVSSQALGALPGALVLPKGFEDFELWGGGCPHSFWERPEFIGVSKVSRSSQRFWELLELLGWSSESPLGVPRESGNEFT